MFTTRSRLPFAMVGMALLAAPAAEARQADGALPAAETIIERYVEEIGGREAVLNPASTRATGRFEMPAAGVTARMEVLTSQPNQAVSRVTIPGFGEFRNGYNGEIGWSIDPMAGARVLEGRELAAARDQADPRASIRDADLFEARETVERTEMAGEACYKIRLQWKSGRESFDCYSVETGLLVATVGTQESPMGAVEVTTLMEEYREFGGVLMATRIVQRMMGQEQIMTLENVEFDVSLDADAFVPPAEIRAMLESGSGG